MCLGGHLAYRCALDKRVAAAVCYFATDIHSPSLGEGMKGDSLERTGEIRGELVMVSSMYSTDRRMGEEFGRLTSIRCEQIFGKKDNHVPPEGRDLIRKNLHEKGVCFSFYEVAWAQRK